MFALFFYLKYIGLGEAGRFTKLRLCQPGFFPRFSDSTSKFQ